MRKARHPIFCCYLFAILGGTSTISATTVIVKVEKDRIILAADTRRTIFGELSAHPVDDMCKISTFSKVAFAATGPGITFRQISGPLVVRDWSAFEDAKSSYSAHPHNLLEMAQDWKTRVIQFYTALYFADRKTVEELASSNQSNVLVIGLFAGWDDKGRPTLIAEKMSLDRARLSFSPTIKDHPIVSDEAVLLERERPYTSNDDTFNLTDSDSELGKATAKKWAVIAQRFPESQRDWRWLAFLVESTSALDKAVGKDADVLEIRASGSSWLHCAACSTLRKPQKRAPKH